VQTTVDYIRQLLLGRQVTDFAYTDKATSHFNIAPEDMRAALVDKRLEEVLRHGKWMIFKFEATTVIGHLRMSGRYQISTHELKHPHLRFTLFFDAKRLNYIDQRRFGTFHVVDTVEQHSGLRRLGPDAFAPDIDGKYLYAKFQQTSRPIYSALLDQRVIAGLGNIYVNEVLHACQLHPLTPANQLSLDQADTLLYHAQRIMKLALSLRGTTLNDRQYQTPDQAFGEFAQLLQVYGHKQDPQISVIKIAGRSVFVHKDTPSPKNLS
jgi:formamidopyrimidine-DNA glycosylase